MHDGAAGLDPRLPANIEKKAITSKKGSNRTEVDDLRIRELECQTSLWLDAQGAPTIPSAAIRANIERGARKLKQGTQVREGLIVDSIDEFRYDKQKYGETLEELGKNTQYTVPVKVGQSRIERTRAKFDTWECDFTLEVDDELVDMDQLQEWLDIGGRRIGLGDWRPEKSGSFGRFELVNIAGIE